MAYCASTLKLNELLQIVYHRAVLLTSLKIHAKMLAIRANKNTVEKLLENYNQISISSINTPNLMVVSGPTESILSLFKTLQDQKIEAQKLDNSSFGHSSVANPLLSVYKKYLSKFSFKDPFIKLLSNVTGDFIQTEEISSDYWCKESLFNSVSCYDNGSVNCGCCDSCENRKKAFVEAGILDETVYASKIKNENDSKKVK